MIFFKKTALLKYIPHTVKSTCFKVTNQWVLAQSQGCTITTVSNPRTFSAPQKETLYPRVLPFPCCFWPFVDNTSSWIMPRLTCPLPGITDGFRDGICEFHHSLMESLVLGVTFLGTQPLKKNLLVRKGFSIGLMLCCRHFEILIELFNKGSHMFILHRDLSIM